MAMKMKKFNKTKYLEEHYGGKWKYDYIGSWWCDDDKRHVSRTATCMCDEPCICPCRYYLYDDDNEKSVEIEDWFLT